MGLRSLRHVLARPIAWRIVRACIFGIAGGSSTYYAMLRTPIGQMARASGRHPSVRGVCLLVLTFVVLTFVLDEAFRRLLEDAERRTKSSRSDAT